MSSKSSESRSMCANCANDFTAKKDPVAVPALSPHCPVQQQEIRRHGRLSASNDIPISSHQADQLSTQKLQKNKYKYNYHGESRPLFTSFTPREGASGTMRARTQFSFRNRPKQSRSSTTPSLSSSYPLTSRTHSIQLISAAHFLELSIELFLCCAAQLSKH
jgi:hypothetical protein